MEVVVTGLGLFSPIGIGREAFWASLVEGRGGVGLIQSFDTTGLPICLAAEVRDFEPKRHVANRKQLKVMARDAQLGVAAAALACRDAGIETGRIDPERFGVVLGADRICTSLDDSEPTYRVSIVDQQFVYDRWGIEGMAASFPLNFLKVLPNMIASHISIAQNARGPNNTIHHGEVSGLLAVAEAASVIQRGMADIMLAGGASSQMSPFDCIRHCVIGGISGRQDDPAAAMRPFDADRDGQVWGEGAAVFVLESREHAQARGAEILATVRATASACDPPRRFGDAGQGQGLCRAVRLAMERARIAPSGLGHINADGLSTPADDRLEARVLHDVASETPVIAPKSYFGNLGASAGAMEMAVSVLAMRAGLTPPTLNYERPDPACPVRVVHGTPEPMTHRSALLVNRTAAGQAVAVVLGEAD